MSNRFNVFAYEHADVNNRIYENEIYFHSDNQQLLTWLSLTSAVCSGTTEYENLGFQEWDDDQKGFFVESPKILRRLAQEYGAQVYELG